MHFENLQGAQPDSVTVTNWSIGECIKTLITIISDLGTMTSAVFCRGWSRNSTISRPQLWNKAENWPRFILSVPTPEEEDRGRPMLLLLLARSRGLTSMVTSVPSSPSWTRSRPSWAGARSGDSATSAGRYQARQEIGSISGVMCAYLRWGGNAECPHPHCPHLMTNISR